MKQWKKVLIKFGAILLLPLIVIVVVMIKIFEKPMPRTPEDVADLMEKSLAGDDAAWDELISVPIADPELEAIRKQCLKLNSDSEIQEVVPGFIQKLRTGG
jgi:hypothetical protein